MARFYELQQVGHLLQPDLLFEISGHRREIRRIHVLDVLPLHDILLTFFVLQRYRGRGLRSQHPIQSGSRRRLDNVSLEALCKRLARIQNGSSNTCFG